MKRRQFLSASLAATAAAAVRGASAQTAQTGGQEYYQIRRYQLQSGPQGKLAANYFSVLIPALNRLGMRPVGALQLKFGPETPANYLIIPSSSVESLVTIDQQLAKDEEFLKSADAFWKAPDAAPAFVRVESWLLSAFAGWPRLTLPTMTATGAKRIFQLRTYESPSMRDHVRKIEMFHSGEFEIFKNSGAQPVFFGDTLIGSRMPCLTYMLSFEDDAQMDKDWETFGNDPQWKKLVAEPRFALEATVSNISNLVLGPLSMSQILISRDGSWRSSMSGVLVVMERKGDGAWHRMSYEALAAGQRLANELGVACCAAVLGEGSAIGPLVEDLATKKLESVWAVGNSLLAEYTADGWVAALQQLLAEIKPKFVVLPHTYQVRDFAPALATRLGEVLIGDVTAIHVADAQSGVTFLRQWMQGKLNVEYRHRSEGGVCFVSVQAGSFRADAVKAGTAAVKTFAPKMNAAKIRTRPGEAFRESAQTVDLSTAAVIVSVGRGIGEQENLKLVEDLASALGAELAASRPICDAGWLPMERQVGSSGQTVAPKLYLAVGISGAIQHLVGMKGAMTVVAINKDADAPIFEVADIGVVGDLFEVVPALTRAIRG